MKPRTLALLAALVAALAAFVLLFERKLPSSDERRSVADRIFRFEGAALETLEIEWQGQKLRLEREQGAKGADAVPTAPPDDAAGWRLTEPLAGRADRALVERLVTALLELERKRALEGAARSELGLEPPRGQLRWWTGDASGTLEIGGDVPASGNVVVAVAGQPAPLVVPRALIAELERPPGEWRAKEILPVGREGIERIRLEPRVGGELVLARQGTGFRVEYPYSDAADRDLVDPLLGELTALAAARFVDAPLGAELESALASGPGTLELTLSDRIEPFLITLGSEVGSGLGSGAGSGMRIARAEGQAFETGTRLADSLARPAADWRSRSWTGFDSWRAERIRIETVAAAEATAEETSSAPLELVRKGGDWTSDGETIPYTDVADLVHSLTAARAEGLVPPGDPAAARMPVADPTLTIVLSDAEGAEETLTLYASAKRAGAAGATPEEATIPARVSGRDVVLLLPATLAEELEQKIAKLRAARSAAQPAPEAQAENQDQSQDQDERRP